MLFAYSIVLSYNPFQKGVTDKLHIMMCKLNLPFTDTKVKNSVFVQKLLNTHVSVNDNKITLSRMFSHF